MSVLNDVIIGHCICMISYVPALFPPAIKIEFESSRPTEQENILLERLGWLIGNPSDPNNVSIVPRSVSKTSTVSRELFPPKIYICIELEIKLKQSKLSGYYILQLSFTKKNL